MKQDCDAVDQLCTAQNLVKLGVSLCMLVYIEVYGERFGCQRSETTKPSQAQFSIYLTGKGVEGDHFGVVPGKTLPQGGAHFTFSLFTQRRPETLHSVLGPEGPGEKCIH